MGLAAGSGSPTLAVETGSAQRDEALYRRYCSVCHGVQGQGDGPNAAFLGDDRPRDLTDARYIGGLSDERLYRVISEGGQVIQGSRFMPPWGRTLAPLQIRDLVAHIRLLSTRPPARPDAVGPSAGARLALELGCPGCHEIGELARAPVGPDLIGEGSRVQRGWLVRFLRAPHRIRPAGYHPLSRARMPDFRLSAEEAASMADYLMTQRRSHLEDSSESPQAAEPASRGRDLFRQYACRACHSREGAGGRAGPDLSAVAERLKPGWVMSFVRDPQAIDPLTPMPNLGVGAGDARAITEYLFSGASLPRPDPPPQPERASKGLTLFRALGCAGCHPSEREAVRDRVGPDLSAVGDKLRPAWLSAFLKQPFAVRPGLTARMPDFQLDDAEGNALVAFLTGLKVQTATLSERLRFRGPISQASVQAGRRLASREFLSCSSCHVADGERQGSPDEWAPDLELSARRLDPDWIVRWLQDPQRLAPGTKMPSFFSDETSGPEEILGGDEERQILALRDHILSLAPTGAGDAAASPGEERGDASP